MRHRPPLPAGGSGNDNYTAAPYQVGNKVITCDPGERHPLLLHPAGLAAAPTGWSPMDTLCNWIDVSKETLLCLPASRHPMQTGAHFPSDAVISYWMCQCMHASATSTQGECASPPLGLVQACERAAQHCWCAILRIPACRSSAGTPALLCSPTLSMPSGHNISSTWHRAS